MLRILGIAALVALAFEARAVGELTEAQKAAIDDAVEMAIIAQSSSLSEARATWQGYGSKQSQRWVEVVKGRTGTTFSVDLRAIGGSTQAPEVWIRTEVPAGTFETIPTAVQVKQLTLFSCASRETADSNWSFSDKNGVVVQSGRGSRFDRRAVTPDSTMEAVLEFVCG